MRHGRVAARRTRRRRTGRLVTLAASLTAALTLVAGAGSHLFLAQGDAITPAELVDDLADLERRLDVALLPTVDVSPSATWGTLTGDFVGARVALEDADGELARLVADASDTPGPVADAVETVASSYRTQLSGYRRLAVFEESELGLGTEPPETGPPAGQRVASDPLRGHAEVGLTLLLEALAGFHDGYAVLRDVPEAASSRDVFESRYEQVQEAARAQGRDARVLLSYPTVHLLVGVERFRPVGGSGDPARTVRYVCVDRDDYLEARSQGAVPDLSVPEGAQPELPIQDCPDLENGNEVRPQRAPS